MSTMRERKRFIKINDRRHPVYTEAEMREMFEKDNRFVHTDANFFTWLETVSDPSYTFCPEYLVFEDGYQYPNHATDSTTRQLAVILSQMRDSADNIGSDDEAAYTEACDSYWTLSYHKGGRTFEATLPFFGAEEFQAVEDMIEAMISIAKE